MNAQWRQQLKDKMEGYQRPAPEVMWNEIDKVLDARRTHRTWLWRIAAAIAAVLTITGAGYWTTHQEPTEQLPLTAKTNTDDSPVEPINSIAPASSTTSTTPTTSVTPMNRINVVQASPHSAVQQQNTALPTEDLQNADAVAIVDAVSTADTAATSTSTALAQGEESHLPSLREIREELQRQLPRRSDSRLMAKVYMQNIYEVGRLVKPEYNYKENTQTIINTPETVIPVDEWTSTDSTDSKPIPRRGPENSHSIRYHQPIRLGVSLRYRLDDHWSVESGLLYSLLVTEVDEEEQRHSYIGVPMNLGYRLWVSRRFGMYLSAGATIEKMLDASPWQFSLNTAAGVDYQLTDRLSLYVEPGVGYYFSNRNSIPTVYQHRPFNFDLSLGVRIDLK